MKKSELKKILKPLVSECIEESLMEDGLISGVIAEVVKGMTVAAAPVVEAPPMPPTADDQAVDRMKRNAFSAKQGSQMKEHKQKLMSAIGGEAYNGVNLFEGTTPAPSQASMEAGSSPMSGQSSTDPGVDISSLLGSVGNNWNAHMNEMKDRK